jgi:hypothetical protein
MRKQFLSSLNKSHLENSNTRTFVGLKVKVSVHHQLLLTPNILLLIYYAHTHKQDTRQIIQHIVPKSFS